MSEMAGEFREWEQSVVIGDLATALAAAQAEMKNAAKTSANPFFKSKYADLAEVRDACLPALNKHGIAVVQGPVTRDGRAGVRTMLAHTSGQYMASTAFVTPKDEGPQSYGSVVSYLRRYSLAAMAGVATEDDDGNAAQAVAPKKRATHTTVPAEESAAWLGEQEANLRAAIGQEPPAPKNKPVAGGALPANKVPATHGERSIVEGQVTRIHQLRGELPGWDGDHSHPEHLYTVALRGYKKADGEPATSAKDLTFEQASNLIKRMQGLSDRKVQAFDRMEAGTRKL